MQALCTLPASRSDEGDAADGGDGGPPPLAEGEGGRSSERRDAAQRMYRQAIGVDYKQFQKLLQARSGNAPDPARTHPARTCALGTPLGAG